MRQNEVAKIIVDVAYHIHTRLGRRDFQDGMRRY